MVAIPVNTAYYMQSTGRVIMGTAKTASFALLETEVMPTSSNEKPE